MTTTRVIIKDARWDAYVDDVEDLEKDEAVVGFFDAEQAGIAAVHEFGDPQDNIPERPFMKRSFSKGKAKYEDLMKGQTPRALREAAVAAQEDIKAEIRDLRSPSLEADTVEEKGSSNPLIDSGRMLRSVKWKIRRRKL